MILIVDREDGVWENDGKEEVILEGVGRSGYE